MCYQSHSWILKSQQPSPSGAYLDCVHPWPSPFKGTWFSNVLGMGCTSNMFVSSYLQVTVSAWRMVWTPLIKSPEIWENQAWPSYPFRPPNWKLPKHLRHFNRHHHKNRPRPWGHSTRWEENQTLQVERWKEVTKSWCARFWLGGMGWWTSWKEVLHWIPATNKLPRFRVAQQSKPTKICCQFLPRQKTWQVDLSLTLVLVAVAYTIPRRRSCPGSRLSGPTTKEVFQTQGVFLVMLATNSFKQKPTIHGPWHPPALSKSLSPCPGPRLLKGFCRSILANKWSKAYHSAPLPKKDAGLTSADQLVVGDARQNFGSLLGENGHEPAKAPPN